MKRKTWAMLGIMTTAAMQGLLAAWLGHARQPVADAVTFGVFTFFAVLFPFAWLSEDRKERGLQRSYWFDVGVVSLAFIVIPAYLWRSRPRGRKLLAQLGMIGTLFASLVVSVCAAVVGLVATSFLYGLPQS